MAKFTGTPARTYWHYSPQLGYWVCFDYGLYGDCERPHILYEPEEHGIKWSCGHYHKTRKEALDCVDRLQDYLRYETELYKGFKNPPNDRSPYEWKMLDCCLLKLVLY